MEKIYILLIRTNTYFSRLIGHMTGAAYTHASFGFTPDCRELYSFAREYSSLPLPAGLVGESIDRGLMGKNPDIPCALLEVSVSPESYGTLLMELDRMMRNRSHFRYSLIGPILCFFGRPLPGRRTAFFCSQFVAHMLHHAGAISLEKSAALYRPNDFLVQPECSCIYQGTLRDLKALADDATFSNVRGA